MTCSGPSFGLALSATTPSFSIGFCGFTISLPSFTFSLSLSLVLPSFSIALFLKLFLNLSICDLSLSFHLGASVGLSAGACVPDLGLEEGLSVAA